MPSSSAGRARRRRSLDWRTRIHPDDVDRIVAESIAGEATRQAASRSRAATGAHDGEYRWLRSVSSPRFGPDGELVGFIGVASDITLAKEAELELKAQVEERTAKLARSEAQFRAIFETVLEVLVLLEPDGTIVELNRKEAAWRDTHSDARRSARKIWDAPTLQAYPQHIPLIKRAVATAAKGEAVQRGSDDGARRRADRLPRHFDAAGARRRRRRSSICCSKRATSPT